ncbi:hypothetical protein DF185_23150, partial [Marinifilum breve]
YDLQNQNAYIESGFYFHKFKQVKRCYNCGSTKHLIQSCKKYNSVYQKVKKAKKVKKIWVPKKPTNPSGPILKWVPKLA